VGVCISQPATAEEVHAPASISARKFGVFEAINASGRNPSMPITRTLRPSKARWGFPPSVSEWEKTQSKSAKINAPVAAQYHFSIAVLPPMNLYSQARRRHRQVCHAPLCPDTLFSACIAAFFQAPILQNSG
jgi:uncharacterized protein YfaA (DUF2138 family)